MVHLKKIYVYLKKIYSYIFRGSKKIKNKNAHVVAWLPTPPWVEGKYQTWYIADAIMFPHRAECLNDVISLASAVTLWHR